MDKQRQEELEKQIAETRQLIGEYEELFKTTPEYEVIERAGIKLTLGVYMTELIEAQAELMAQAVSKPVRETRRQQLEKLLKTADNLANELNMQLAKFSDINDRQLINRSRLNRQLKFVEEASNNWKMQLAALSAVEAPPDQRSEQLEEWMQKAYNLEQTLLVTLDPMSKARMQFELGEISEQIKQLETDLPATTELPTSQTDRLEKLYNNLLKLDSYIYLIIDPLKKTKLKTERNALREQISMLEAEITGESLQSMQALKSSKDIIERAYQLKAEIGDWLALTTDPIEHRRLQNNLREVESHIKQLEAELDQGKAE